MPGDRPDPTWWFVLGTRRVGEHVRAELVDGTPLTAVRVGYLWACEWVSLPMDVVVSMGATVHRVSLTRRPDFLGPPPHPEVLPHQK